jgi:type IV secretory pathway VirB2 component (pilin)
VQEKLVGTLLPLAAMCGLVIAGLSFVAGHPNARQHLVYAIVGAIVGFGSESIVSFIRNLIH